MHTLRNVLCWLLAALLPAAGLPARSSAAACDRDQAGSPSGVGSSCCAPGQCTCPPKANCGCGRRAPDPAPAPPAPKQPQQLCEELPAPRLRPANAKTAADARIATALQRPHGLLPRRTRQEALSVWRL